MASERTGRAAGRRGNREGSNARQRADGRWAVNIRHVDRDGVPRRETAYGKTAPEARRNAAAIRKRLDAGEPARDQKATVGATAETWIDSSLAISERKATTKAMYGTVARRHIVDTKLGAVPLDRLRPTHVEAWLVELRGRDLAPSTIRSAYAVLRAVLDTAVRDGALAKNPAAVVSRPKVEHVEAHYLTAPQVRQLLDAAAGGRFSPLLELLVRTGLRRGEALALRWPDVDLTNGVARVRGTLARVNGALEVSPPKTAKSRRSVALTADAVRILQTVKVAQAADRAKAGSQWVESGYVFTTESGRPCDPRNALRAVQAAAKKAGLEGVGLHTLRHSAASLMLSGGIPLKVVSELLGHASIVITADVYGHVSPDVSREALDSLSKALSA